jgi:uncharacterized protein (DUF2336 family)
MRAQGATGGGPIIGVAQADADQRVTARSFRALSLRLRPANDTEAGGAAANCEPEVADEPVLALPLSPHPLPEPSAEPAPQTAPVAANASPDRPHDATEAERGELVRLLLDIMARPAPAAQPQERAMAADILCRLLPRLPGKLVKLICERVSVTRDPPAPLLSSLLTHADTALIAALLESAAIGDLELERVVASGDLERIRLIARRRVLPQGLVARLVASDDPAVLLALLRNPGAELSVEVFRALAAATRAHPMLQAPLMTRADTPPAIAFDLFFDVPRELRRYVLTRFLADSSAIGRMLKIVAAIDRGSLARPGNGDVAGLIAALAGGAEDEAARLLAAAAGLPLAAARAILADAGGEPLAIALKAIGIGRKDFAACLKILKSSGPHFSEGPAATELQELFDSLSYNKAKVLLTYWGWRFGV